MCVCVYIYIKKNPNHSKRTDSLGTLTTELLFSVRHSEEFFPLESKRFLLKLNESRGIGKAESAASRSKIK